MKFHIVTAMYNFSKWVEANIQMLKAQSDADFQCIMIDDMSTDDTVDCALRAINGDPRFKVVVNSQRQYKARNVVQGIAMAGAQDGDVIVMIDGDDKLAGSDVLEQLRALYEQTGCWMTYGSYANSKGVRDKVCRPYDKAVISNNSFRKHRWLASHLKTFKYGLWKNIQPDAFQITDAEYKKAVRRALLSARFRAWYHWRKIKVVDLHDESGKFIRRIDDKAFTFPMLEMAGERAIFVEDILYIYNTDNARMSSTIYGQHQKKWPGRLVRDIVCHKPSYQRLSAL